MFMLKQWLRPKFNIPFGLSLSKPCSRITASFDKPVLSVVEGLSRNSIFIIYFQLLKMAHYREASSYRMFKQPWEIASCPVLAPVVATI